MLLKIELQEIKSGEVHFDILQKLWRFYYKYCTLLVIYLFLVYLLIASPCVYLGCFCSHSLPAAWVLALPRDSTDSAGDCLFHEPSVRPLPPPAQPSYVVLMVQAEGQGGQRNLISIFQDFAARPLTLFAKANHTDRAKVWDRKTHSAPLEKITCKEAAQGMRLQGTWTTGACAQLTHLSNLPNAFQLTSSSEKPDI